METTPILELRSSDDLVRKSCIGILAITIVLGVTLFVLLPPLFAGIAFAAYLMTILYGFYAMKQLDLRVMVFRDRLVVKKGPDLYTMPYENIRLILVQPRVVSISLPFIEDKVRLPKVVSSTFIVRIFLNSGQEVHFQLFQDEKEKFLQALDKARRLGAKLPRVETLL